MSKWIFRKEFPYYYQDRCPFKPNDIVQVCSFYEDVHSNIGPAQSFWWGYEEECGQVGEGVIYKARVLSKPKGGPLGHSD